MTDMTSLISFVLFELLSIFMVLINGGRGERSICRWTRNEDFQYFISRFWEKYGRETVSSTLDGAGNCWKK